MSDVRSRIPFGKESPPVDVSKISVSLQGGGTVTTRERTEAQELAAVTPSSQNEVTQFWDDWHKRDRERQARWAETERRENEKNKSVTPAPKPQPTNTVARQAFDDDMRRQNTIEIQRLIRESKVSPTRLDEIMTNLKALGCQNDPRLWEAALMN